MKSSLYVFSLSMAVLDSVTSVLNPTFIQIIQRLRSYLPHPISFPIVRILVPLSFPFYFALSLLGLLLD